MNHLLRGSLIVLLAFAVGGCKKKVEHEAGRYYDKDDNLSFKIPSGWQKKTFQGKPVIVDTPQGGFAPNINVVNERTSVSPKKYADVAMKKLPQKLPGVKNLARGTFTTAKGEEGTTVSFLNSQQGFRLWQIQYYFKDGGRIHVITGSTTESDRKRFEKIMAETMKTLRFE